MKPKEKKRCQTNILKPLLIIGGTDSFGNAVLDRFLNTDIEEIRIFSRDEKKQHDMRLHYNNDKIKFYIGVVCLTCFFVKSTMFSAKIKTKKISFLTD